MQRDDTVMALYLLSVVEILGKHLFPHLNI